MGNKRLQPSEQWENINRCHLTEESLADLEGFKSSVVNHKLAVWNPATNGVRFLKELVHNLCRGLTDEQWNMLDRTEGRELGRPYAVTYHGRSVCLDYLQAVYEMTFLQSNLNLADSCILEIGAGYGRTAHLFLCNADVAAYTIVDLPGCLDLSRRYLKAVLPGSAYAKLHFMPADQVDSLSGDFDLALNIDSFAEMDESVVHQYLSLIDRRCKHFYVKNPVGKYLDPSLDSHAEGNEAVRMALASGVLRDVIDIHDDQVVLRQSERFLEAYAPSADWTVREHEWARPWSYYWQALYSKRGV